MVSDGRPEVGLTVRAVLRPAARHGGSCLKAPAWTGPDSATTLAGPLGTALADRLFALDWVRRSDRRRVVRLTDSGRENLPGTLGLPSNWDQPAEVSRLLAA